MHTVFGKVFRYVLWILLLAILFFLLIGLSKYHWSVSEYVKFLNEKDWNDAWKEGTISGIFRAGTGSSDQGIVTGNQLSVDENLTDNGELNTGNSLDVYDPSFEEDLNQIPQDSSDGDDYSAAETGFGFVTSDGTTTSSETSASGSGQALSGDSKAQLLELVKKREMAK